MPFLGLALACFAAAELASRVVVGLGGESYAIFWIPVGFLTGALITAEQRRWPGLMAAAAIGILASGLLVQGHPPRAELIAAAISLSEAVAVAWLVRRVIGEPFTLTSVPHVWNLALVCTMAAVLAGLVAALGDTEATSFLLAWRSRAMAEIDGLMLAAPFAIACIQGPGVFHPHAPTLRRIETAVALVLAVVVLELVFGDFAPSVLRVPAYILPMLLWIAFRAEAGDASTAMFLVCVVGVWNTAEGRGPFTLVTSTTGIDAWILRAQGAAVTTSLSIMLLAAVVAERKRAAEERDELVFELQQALAEIKTLHGLIPLCAWCHKIRNDGGSWEGLESYLQEHTDATFSHGICPSCSLIIDAEHIAEAEARSRRLTS
jgi:integral membrane sensor domain MASE1